MKNATTATKEAKKAGRAKSTKPEKAAEVVSTLPVANSKDDEIKVLRELLEAQAREIAAMKSAAPVVQTVQVSASTEKVQFLWQAEVADDNIVEFGRNGMYGRITGKTGSFYIPKDDMSQVMDGLTRYFIDNRWLIVVSGLNEEEREAYGVNYKEGELLDRKAFAKMIDLGDGLIDLYPKLCPGHREMVAKRLYEAWNSNDKRVNRSLIFKLNTLSKEMGSEKGDFYTLLTEMNEAEINS